LAQRRRRKAAVFFAHAKNPAAHGITAGPY